MSKVWILLSSITVNGAQQRVLQGVFWERPSIEDISLFLTGRLVPESEVLKDLFENIRFGLQIKLYGADYWVQEFIKP